MASKSAASKAIEFSLYAPQAKKVSLAGSFNKWNSKLLSAKKDSKGNWKIAVDLKPGQYEYKFFVDGNWMDDPKNNWRMTNSFGTSNCMIEVK